MTDDDDLKINTLHRFAKHSARLVLHEYSHCEVPAGCGGVVLRWMDPARGRPVTVRVAKGDVWIDGVELEVSHTQLVPGMHLLAVHGRDVQPRVTLDGDVRELPLVNWRCTQADPGPGWQAVAFDDRSWRGDDPGGEQWVRVMFQVPA